METITINIDGQEIISRKNATVLETALENKIFIPHLCYHPDLSPAGSCRLCLVELDNGKIVTSCRLPVKEGMIIKTNSLEIDRIRRPIVEMIVSNHHMDCKNCLKKGSCILQRIMAFMKIDKQKINQNYRLSEKELPVDESNPFFIRNHNKCVLCGICVRTCREITKINAIDFSGRGNNTKVSTFGDKPIAQSKCVSCGECVVRCPVGALVVRTPKKPFTEIKTVCPHCGVGCGVYAGVKDNQIVSVKGDKLNHNNNGILCVKGRFGLDFVSSSERLKNPIIKKKEVTWNEAFDYIAGKLKRYKGDDFAMISSPKCTNEENYIAQKFARVVMGSNNIDTPVRLCSGPTLAALRRTGNWMDFDKIYEDPNKPPDLLQKTKDFLEYANCIILAGTNITKSYPVLGVKIKKVVEKGAKLIVISPNKTELTCYADKWLQPYPGTDLAIAMGMCNVIVEEGLYNEHFLKTYCNNFDEFRECLEDFSPKRVERITGVSHDLIEDAAKIYSENKPGTIFWGTGITQYSHGTENVYSLINLALITGNIQFSHSLIPLWRQSNALGACDMGCLPDYYPGYQPVDSEEISKKFSYYWNKDMNLTPGLTLNEILDAAVQGKIKSIYVIGANLAATIAPPSRVQTALKKSKFIVVQDMFLNETSGYADVILPASGFGEKSGSVINFQGKVQRVNKALNPENGTMSDWEILCEIAKRMKCKGFEYNSSDDILDEINTVIQDFQVKIDKFSLFPLQYNAPEEITDIDYPLYMITERDLFTGGVIVNKMDGFRKLRSNDVIYMNPKDADDYAFEEDERVMVISRHGKKEGILKITKCTPAGVIVTNIDKNINQLFNPVIDNSSRTPEMKMCAVRVEKIKSRKK